MFTHAASTGTAISVDEPRSYAEAMSSPHRAQWEQAMQEELDSIRANNTYTLVALPAGRRAIGCKFLYVHGYSGG